MAPVVDTVNGICYFLRNGSIRKCEIDKISTCKLEEDS